MEKLLPEIIVEILDKCDACTTARVSMVCKLWNELIRRIKVKYIIWKLFEAKNEISPRRGHGACYDEESKQMIVCGGYGGGMHLNDVWRLDFTTDTWHCLKLKGSIPAGRSFFTFVAIGQKQYLAFGGYCNYTPVRNHNDVAIVRVEDDTAHWITPEVVGDLPHVRESHSSTLIDRTLYIFGGAAQVGDIDYSIIFNDLYILQLPPSGLITSNSIFTWKKIQTTSLPPSPRWGHSAVLLNDRESILFYGGTVGMVQPTSDVYILNTKELVWSKLTISGPPPLTRSRQSATLYGNQIYIFGGLLATGDYEQTDELNILNLDSMQWETSYIGVGTLTKRYGHTSTLVDNKIVCVGGAGPHSNKIKGLLNDIVIFHKWSPHIK